MSKPKKSHTLIDLILKSKDAHQLAMVLDSLLTPGELAEFNNRILILEMLTAGASQREIAESLGVGIATVTRGAKVLRESPNFAAFIQSRGTSA